MGQSKQGKNCVWIVERQDRKGWRPIFMDISRNEACADAKWRRSMFQAHVYRVRKYIREGK